MQNAPSTSLLSSLFRHRHLSPWLLQLQLPFAEVVTNYLFFHNSNRGITMEQFTILTEAAAWDPVAITSHGGALTLNPKVIFLVLHLLLIGFPSWGNLCCISKHEQNSDWKLDQLWWFTEVRVCWFHDYIQKSPNCDDIDEVFLWSMLCS